MKLQVSCIWNLQTTPQRCWIIFTIQLIAITKFIAQMLPPITAVPGPKHSEMKCYKQHLQQGTSKSTWLHGPCTKYTIPRSTNPKTKSIQSISTNQPTPIQKFYPTTNLDLRLENSHLALNESQTWNATNRICSRKIQNRNWVRTLCINYSTLGCRILTTKIGRSSISFLQLKFQITKVWNKMY